MIDFVNVSKDSKIVVALSGGVDSSTTIALLLEQGYTNVVGMTLILHQNDYQKGIISKDQNVVQDCQKVATLLGIEHHFIDIKQEFMDIIIDPFLKSYQEGVSFNPCVTCNREVKFGLLYKACQDLNADFLVTGHYIKWGPGADNGGAIYRSKSQIRDQSYFLSMIKKDVLPYIRFPLANLSKEQVREQAQRLGLHVSQKKASSDLCFAGIGNYSKIVDKNVDEDTKGHIVDVNGKILGEHNGIHNFTIGQRKGIGIGGFKEPQYIIKLDTSTNEVVVGDKSYLAVQEVYLQGVNWLAEDDFYAMSERTMYAKVRASQVLQKVTVYPDQYHATKVVFENPIYGVAKGQVCSFYDENRLLGGSYI